MDFTGTWHIYEMELWDEDYFNMEVQAYIKIEPDNSGCFQFGLVYGDIDGGLLIILVAKGLNSPGKEMMNAIPPPAVVGSG